MRHDHHNLDQMCARVCMRTHVHLHPYVSMRVVQFFAMSDSFLLCCSCITHKAENLYTALVETDS